VAAAVTAAGCSRERPAPARTDAAPVSGPAEYVMGLKRMEQGNLFGAAFLFERAVRSHPDSLDYRFKLGETYTLLGADDRDYFAKAERLYDDLQSVVGEFDERLRVSRAKLLQGQLKIDPAIEIYQQLVIEHQDDCEYWIQLGRAEIQKAVVLRGTAGLKAQMDQLEIAAETYRHAVELCPDRLDAYWGEAVLREQKKDFKGLIELYEGLMERFPDNPEPLRRYTYAHYMMRDWEGAVEPFKKLLDLDYTLDDHRMYIVCLYKLGRTEEEEKQIEIYKATAPQPEGPVYLTDVDRLRIQMNVNPITDKAGTLFEEGKYEEALDLWREVRGMAEARLGDEEFGDAAQEFIVWLDRRIQLAERRLSGEPDDPVRN
jgi:tetratricopeptide (TPR) repeat protein